MKRLSEKDLQENVEKFNNKNIIFSLGGIANVKIDMEMAKCKYNNRNGILKVKGTKADISIDTTSAYRMQISENNSMLEIFLDNGIDIMLEK